MKHIAIVGSGVIGLTLAWELQRRGYDVTLIDEQLESSGASMINAGWIVPAMSAPIPAPGVIPQSLKWLLKPDAPFSLSVHPNVEFMRWMISFIRACSPEQFARGYDVMSRLCADAFPQLDRLIAAGVEMEHHADGLLYAFTSEKTLHHELDLFERYHPAGYSRVVPLRGSDLYDREPTLTNRNVAGFMLENERVVRPESLMAGLFKALAGTSVRVLAGHRISRLVRSGRNVVGIVADDVRIDADAFVIAAGVGIRPLLKTVGIRVPIESGKGYSLTWTTSGTRPSFPVYLHDDRIAVTPFDDAIRAAGTMHLGATKATMSQRKIAAIASAARASFTGWPATDRDLAVSFGLRPVSPDGLPVIGRVDDVDNLFVAGGHAMLGVTLAPVTAFELANLIETGHPSAAIAPLAPGRFA